MIRVYQYRIYPPHENAAVVHDQLKAAHEYRNQLVAIERTRRAAIRAMDEASPEVVAAVELVKSATRTDRRQRVRELNAARKAARLEGVMKEINDREHELLLSARALTRCYWGSYLDIEAAHRQSRQQPFYGDDALEPNDPAFQCWRDEGQIGIQLQKGLPTPELLAGSDTKARLVNGILWLRVGSDGRAPIWAKFRVSRNWTHKNGETRPVTNPKRLRVIPDNACIKWVRVSLRQDGPFTRWSCEFTLELPGEHPHVLDTSLKGAVAVEVAWDKPGDDLVVARWRDDRGRTGTYALPHRIETGIRKPDGIRSVRDTILNAFRPMIQRMIQSNKGLPDWLIDAAKTMHLWKSPGGFHRIFARWHAEMRGAGALREETGTFEAFRTWDRRDMHLWQYETGARQNAIRWRKHVYRMLAAGWAREYKTVILDDRDLAREARWGEASDLRFTAAPFDLRECLRQAFGPEAIKHPFKYDDPEDERDWCERAIEVWAAGGARDESKPKEIDTKKKGAWAARKAWKLMKETAKEAPRGETDNPPE